MEELAQRRKDEEAFKWLFTEVLIKQFNNILTKKWYQYYIKRYLKNGDVIAKKKLKDHNEAIYWFLYERDSLCFRVLGIDWLPTRIVIKAISKKFNGEKKFIKILKDFTERKSCDS